MPKRKAKQPILETELKRLKAIPLVVLSSSGFEKQLSAAILPLYFAIEKLIMRLKDAGLYNITYDWFLLQRLGSQEALGIFHREYFHAIDFIQRIIKEELEYKHPAEWMLAVTNIYHVFHANPWRTIARFNRIGKAPPFTLSIE